MKKILLSAAVAAALLSSSAFAAPSGGLDLTVGSSNVSNNYGDGKSVAVGGYVNVNKDTIVNASVTSVEAWKSNGTYFSLGGVRHLTDRLYVDGGVGFSSDTNILAKNRFTAKANYRLTERKNIVGSIGYDHIEMNGGSKADALLLGALWYVPNMPVVVQADARFSNATPGDHNSHLYGVAVTYGRVGEWTVTGRADTGTVGYESTIVPGQLVDYSSRHQSVTGRYWMSKDWGFQVALDNVTNKYYDRKEVRTTVFYNF